MKRNIERMAQDQKFNEPLEISIPNALAPIVEAYSVESESTAKALIEKAAKAIYGRGEYGEREVKNEEVESTFALMKAIRPSNALETICASQVVVGHLLGLRKLSQSFKEDQRIGLKLLRFSNEALGCLEKLRGNGGQQINVVYQNVGPTVQTLVASTAKE